MKWPCVTRRAYDAEVARGKAWEDWCRDLVNDRDAERAVERARFADLLDKYHSLRAVGFEPRPVMPPRAAVNPTPSDEAINERAATRPALRRHLIAWRNGERQKPEPMSEQELARRIADWSDNGTGDES